MSKGLWDKLHEKGFDGIGKESDSDSVADSNEQDSDMSDLSMDDDEYSADTDQAAQNQVDAEESSDSELEDDSKIANINAMADQMEHVLSKQKEYAMQVDRKAAKQEYKTKQLIEIQRAKLEDMAEQEALNNEKLMRSESDSDLQGSSASDALDGNSESGESSEEEEDGVKKPRKHRGEKKAGKDIESEGGDSDEDLAYGAANSAFINPLAAATTTKTGQGSDEEWSSDESEKGKKSGKKDVVGKKRKRKGSFDDVQDFFKNDAIEEVPANDHGTREQQGYDSMDSDDIAATRILARKMLRKKARNEIIDASMSKYSTHEDPSTLPTWFVEDEAKHRFCERIQPTKEEMAEEKEALKAYNARPSKKVEQAKMRKRKRLAKAMDKIKKKAQVIADQDLNEASKMKQIQKLYRKEKAKHKEEKSYVVNRSFNTSQGGKTGRNVKVVDRRMRKDLRNEKFRAKKGGSKGKVKKAPSRGKVVKGGKVRR